MAKKRNTSRRVAPSHCPCDSGEAYSQCCGPLHDGAVAAQDAVQLMRSRFSAFALGKPAYLWRTLHPEHDDCAGGEEAFLERLTRDLGACRYRGLRILDSRGEDGQGAAQVLFLATVKQHKLDRSFIELSDFVRDEEGIRYIAGTARPLKDLGHAPEEMTIEHWQCGHQHEH